MVSYTDTFGPMIFRAVKQLQSAMEKASQKNAYYIQSQWISGIRSQSLKNNPVKNWKTLSEGYLKSKRKQRGSNLINILTGTFTSSIEVVQDGMGYYHVGTNTNEKGFYYPVWIETSKKHSRPTLQPVLILTKDAVLENWKDALKETFQ